ncbi:sensor histidine kinase, partial [Pseudonocardia asaccharolytica]
MTVPAAGRVADAAPAAAARPAVTLPVERADTAPRESRLMVGGYIGLLTLVAVVTVGWLAVGAVVAVAAYRPEVAAAFTEAAQGGSAWARGVQAAIPRSEPFDQLVPDFAFSLLNLVIAVLLLWLGHRAWFIRLLAIAMIGSAGAFNLQAHAAAVAVQIATGLSMGTLHQILLHGVAGAAYILAMLVFPSSLWRLQPDSGLTRRLLLFAGLGALLVAGFATALLPHTTSCVLLFGFGVPLIGLAVLPRRIRRGPTAGQRTQARLLFSVLAAAFATTVVLGVITLLLVVLDWPGLTVHDPTAGGEHGEPTGLLFWFARLAAAAIAGAVLVASRRTRLWTAERLFSRGLATALLVTLLGGGYVVARAVTMVLLVNWPVAPVAATALPTALVALAALPLYVRVERLVDRLLYGTRPTPYSVLAEVAALSRATSTDAPDLTRMAEAVARGLGATSCSLTVFRAGLRDRTYRWSDTGSPPAAEDLVAVPIRHGEEQIGRIAVDRAAVAGLHAERAHLLADIADSLGVVLQASRFGIELERQLRAAVAHAEEIAVSRRQAVAEMDAERRRIERDLHDGAQHHLVSLSLTLGLVELQVATGDRDQARRQLDQVEEQLGTAEAVLAETATGVSSTALSTHGLYAALTADLAGGPAPVAVDTDDAVAGRRFPAEIEAAVYFCCLEAVNNARKHAPGAPIALRLAETDGRLTFTVRDDGPGFAQDRDPRAAGRGLRNVMTRISAVGGTIAVRSAPGAGTSMEGSVPVPAAPAPAAAGPPATP